MIQQKIINTTFQIARIVVSALFLFSGVTKLVDPLGFSYKMEKYFRVFAEYLEFFSSDFMIVLTLPASILISMLEMIMGFTLLLGLYRKFTTTLLLILILFFTFLTGFSAITGKVTDCGCFGEALSLTPWESFYKNIGTLILIGFLFWKRELLSPLLQGTPAKISLGAWTFLILGISLYGYFYLPIIDFRPYLLGANIPEKMKVPEGAPETKYKTVLVYKNTKTGKTQKFDADSIPGGDQWKWQETNNELVQQGYVPPIQDFSISKNGQDYTDSFLNLDKPLLLVTMHHIGKASKGNMKALSALTQRLSESQISVIGLTASTNEKVAALKDSYGLTLPFYKTDGVVLKTMVRANPGLILLEEGTVRAKWPHTDLPTVEAIERKTGNGH